MLKTSLDTQQLCYLLDLCSYDMETWLFDQFASSEDISFILVGALMLTSGLVLNVCVGAMLIMKHRETSLSDNKEAEVGIKSIFSITQKIAG